MQDIRQGSQKRPLIFVLLHFKDDFCFVLCFVGSHIHLLSVTNVGMRK